MEDFFHWLSKRLPAALISWCAIQVVANATANHDKDAHDLIAMEAIGLWDKDHQLD